MSSIKQKSNVFQNFVAIGKIVVFDNKKEVLKIEDIEIEELFEELNNHTIDEYIQYREAKMAISEDETRTFELLDFVFFTFDTESINLRFRELVTKEKVCMAEAFESAIREFITGDRFFFPRSVKNEKELIENYFFELKNRLKIRYEMVMLQRLIKSINYDYILCVEEFRKEYFDKIEQNLQGMICRTAIDYDLVKLFAHEFEIPIAIHNQDFNEGTKVILDGISSFITINPTHDEINSFYEIIKSKTYYIGENPSYPPSKINIYAPLVDNRYVKRIAHSTWYTGIAPFKSEYMFVTSGKILPLKQQYERYLKLMKDIDDKEIYIRVPDFRPERPTEFLGDLYTDKDAYETYTELFDNNLRAIAMASKVYNRQVNMVVPMVRMPEEIEYWRRQIESAFQYYGVDNVKVGIMIETESAFEYFEDYKTMDFAIIGLNDLIEEITDDFDRYSNLTKDQMLDIFWPELRELHQFLRTFKMQTKHIVAGNFLNNPEILLKLINTGFTNFSVQLSQIRRIENVLKVHADTRGTFKGVAAQRVSMRAQIALDQIERKYQIEKERKDKEEMRYKKQKEKEQAERDNHKEKRERVIKKMLEEKRKDEELKKKEKNR